MPDLPTLSVVFINYNHGLLLRRSLPALFAQTHPAKEWILIDDGSTDDSRAQITELSRGQPHVTIIHHDTNLGAVATIMEGLRCAQGDYVYFAAADDVTLPDLFTSLLNVAAARPGVGLCLSDYYEFDDATGAIRRRHVCLGNTAEFLNGESFGRLLLSGERFYYPACGALVRRESLLQLNALDPRAEWFLDWWANLRVGLAQGVCFVPEALAGFRVSASSYSGAKQRNPRELRRVVGQLWDSAAADPAGAETRWLGAMAAMPRDARRLMWREIVRHPRAWGWLRAFWRLALWPGLRPWIWPITQTVVRWFPGRRSMLPGMLRFFGATIAPDADIDPSVTIDRPWRLRVDAKARMEAGVKICAKDAVFLGAHAVLESGCVIDTAKGGPDATGPDAMLIGEYSRVGARGQDYAGAAIAAKTTLPPESVVRGDDAPEPARMLLRKILAIHKKCQDGAHD